MQFTQFLELRQTDTDHQSGYRYLCYRLGSWDELVFLVLTGNWLPSNFWHSLACQNPQTKTHLDILQWSFPHLNKPSDSLRTSLYFSPNFYSESACGTLFNACKKKKNHLTELVSLSLCVFYLAYILHIHILGILNLTTFLPRDIISPSISIFWAYKYSRGVLEKKNDVAPGSDHQSQDRRCGLHSLSQLSLQFTFMSCKLCVWPFLIIVLVPGTDVYL